jgi:chorismate dehydratase
VVEYLNARPLAFGLGRASSGFSVRFDTPARCASLLHDGGIDLGTIPSIEYLRGGEFRIVPGIAIGCEGAIDSVAVFTSKPIDRVRTLALDTSSRTSVALARILCARHYGIAPEMRPMPQDPVEMLRACDAAVVIGDAALVFDAQAAGVGKIDLGLAWRDFTGLPFVFAFWAGRPGAVNDADVAVLQAARDGGVAAADTVASGFFRDRPEFAGLGARYLRDNVKYGFSDSAIAGAIRFFREAVELGLAPAFRDLRFY